MAEAGTASGLGGRKGVSGGRRGWGAKRVGDEEEGGRRGWGTKRRGGEERGGRRERNSYLRRATTDEGIRGRITDARVDGEPAASASLRLGSVAND